MNEFRKYWIDHKFNSIFFKNLARIFIVLALPIMIVSLATVLLVDLWQRDELVMEANSRITKIASEMDHLWSQQIDSAFNLCYDKAVGNFSGFVDQPLTQKKIDSLQKVQARLIYTNDTNEITNDVIVFYSRQSKYVVTPKIAMTLFEMKKVTYFNTSYYRRLNLLTDSAANYTLADYGGNSIIFHCSSQKTGGVPVHSFVISNKDTVAEWIRAQTGYSDEIVLLLDEEGNYVAGSGGKPDLGNWSPQDYIEGHREGFVTLGDSRYLAVAYQSSAQDWDYVLLYPTNAYFKTRNLMILLAAGILALLLCFSVFSSWRISVSFYRPIQIILSLLQSPKTGTMEYYQQYCRKYDEMNMISTLIQNSYFRQLSISRELDERKRLLQRAQNYALAAQINPHFIFNTLESINWKVVNILKGENEISTAMSDFSQLMRYSLHNKGLVKIIDEIDHARIYLRLRNSRATPRFTAMWDIDETVLTAVTPFLVIQPLVENAITHGIKDMAEEGRITIRCYGKSDSVILEVEDNGVGILPPQIGELEARFLEDAFEESLHIGLVNTHHRIRLTFGDEWGLKIESKPGRTVVSICISKIFDERELGGVNFSIG